MKKRWLLIPFLIILAGCSQRAHTGKQVVRISIEESVIGEMNLAREHPKEYIIFLKELKSKYDGIFIMRPEINARIRTKEGVKAVDEAIRYLETASPVHPLTLSKGMSLGASDHVIDQGHAGSYGHEGSDGSYAGVRVNRHGEWKGSVGENIAYGQDSAREIVLGLIVDDDVPDRGHRNNIFDPDFFVAGAAFGYHQQYRTMCVITFATKYIEED